MSHSRRIVTLMLVLALTLLAAIAIGACRKPTPSYDPALVAAAPTIDWYLLYKGLANERRTREREELLGAGPVRIAGYLVSLDHSRPDQDPARQREFLLVPYAGACMHLPPPPPDQMIHVHIASDQLKSVNIWSWKPLEVAGVLREEPLKSVYGEVGYRMDGIAIREYGSDWGAF